MSLGDHVLRYCSNICTVFPLRDSHCRFRLQLGNMRLWHETLASINIVNDARTLQHGVPVPVPTWIIQNRYHNETLSGCFGKLYRLQCCLQYKTLQRMMLCFTCFHLCCVAVKVTETKSLSETLVAFIDKLVYFYSFFTFTGAFICITVLN